DERPRRSEVVDRDDVARANDVACERAGQREAASARDRQHSDRRDELALLTDRLQHGRAFRGALRRCLAAEGVEQGAGVGLPGHLAGERTKGRLPGIREGTAQGENEAAAVVETDRRVELTIAVVQPQLTRRTVSARGSQRVEELASGIERA